MSNPPQTLGQYQIIREIARSNDIVYEAYDPLMNRRVAVKELSMPAGMTPQQLEDRIARFRREAQAVGSLNHPHIMTVYSFSEDNGRYFMAMEFLDGITLRKEIDNNGFLTQERAIEIISETLQGLHHAHEAGVVHRDIKPDNIQIISNGTVKITDFGIARLTFQPNLTMDGQVFGTPSYMSPEQVVGKEIDNRTDLFSVGVMLYEMLTGNKPFQGDNVIAITHAIVNTIPNCPPSIDYNIWKIIERSLEKAPQMRFHNANEMRSALEDSVAPQPQAYQSPTPAAFDPYSQPPAGLIPPAPQQYPDPYAQQPYNQTPYGGVVPGTQYNPYGAAPPVVGNLPPPVIANPPTYGQGQYSPYQQPNPGQFMPPQQPYSVYYPPPPGPPLISKDTREKMRHYVMALIVLGLFAAIIVVAFVTIANNAQSSSGATKSPKSSAASVPPSSPEANNAPVSAEEGASKLEDAKAPPENTGPRSIKGDMYYASALTAESSESKIDYFTKAGDAYREEGSSDKAVTCFWQAYQIMDQSGSEKRLKRNVLNKIILTADPSSKDYSDAKFELDRIQNS